MGVLDGSGDRQKGRAINRRFQQYIVRTEIL